MASIGKHTVTLIDSEGDPLQVTPEGKLDVNATLVAGATIDIGDVDMFLDGGTAILGGAGDVEDGVLRVTLASDDEHFGEVGTASDIEGTIHGQLRYIGTSLLADGHTVDCNDSDVTVTSISAGTNAIGKVGHDITGMVSGVNNAVSTGVEDLVGSGSVAIKRIDLFASSSNTGYIWVGDSSVANDGTGGGVRLGAGDFYSMDIDNLNKVHVAATVADEDIMYTYYT